MNLLIVTQKVDSDDQLLGFFIEWILRFSKYFKNVTVLCLQKGRHDLPDNVTVLDLGKDRGASKLSQLLSFYKYIFRERKGYDAVFVHMNPIWAVMGGWWWHLSNKKVYLWYTHKAVTPKLRLAEKFADGIFTASQESFRLPSSKVIVTGHGIDTDLFKPGPHKHAKDGKLRILSVGRIAPIKNYEVLVDAALILKDKELDFMVTMAGEAALEGDKKYERALKSRIQELQLEEHFAFIGKVANDRLPSYYHQHDVLVHLSKTGSLDKVVLEAMASGIAVLSSNDSSKSFLPASQFLDQEDPAELADHIVTICREDYDPLPLRSYVATHHSLSRLIRKMGDIMSKDIKVLVSGYVYVDEIALKTFEYYPGDIHFLVPDSWPIKNGKHVFRPAPQKHIQTTKAFFTHSNYPIIGGIWKGWMPMFPFVLAGQNPDLVLSASEPNLLSTLYQGVFAKLLSKRHVIFTWENIPYRLKFKGVRGFLQNIIVRMNVSLCDGFICGSNRSRQAIRTMTAKPAVVLPSSGTDTDFFVRDRSKKSFQGMDLSDALVFSFIGAIGYRKGVHLIIEAFKEVARAVPRARLIIAGSGEYEPEIERMTNDLGLGDRIIRVSWLNREAVRELLNASDVFLYPSIPHGGWEEQFGYSLIEASAMELPIISTESGSIPEVVLNGETGILIKPNDPQALQQAMTALADDNEKRTTMGKAGRKFVLEHYSHPVIAEKFHRAFMDFASDKK